jgi:hypothetical protein
MTRSSMARLALVLSASVVVVACNFPSRGGPPTIPPGGMPVPAQSGELADRGLAGLDCGLMPEEECAYEAGFVMAQAKLSAPGRTLWSIRLVGGDTWDVRFTDGAWLTVACAHRKPEVCHGIWPFQSPAG